MVNGQEAVRLEQVAGPDEDAVGAPAQLVVGPGEPLVGDHAVPEVNMTKAKTAAAIASPQVRSVPAGGACCTSTIAEVAEEGDDHSGDEGDHSRRLPREIAHIGTGCARIEPRSDGSGLARRSDASITSADRGRTSPVARLAWKGVVGRA